MVKLEYSRYYAIIKYELVYNSTLSVELLLILMDLMNFLLSFVC